MSDGPKPAPGGVEIEVVPPGGVTGTEGESHESLATETEITPEDKPGAEKPEGEEKTPDPDALPDYDPENPEVTAKYDQKFFSEEGQLDTAALTAEFDANLAKGEGGLNEGTYKYLEKTLGLSREAIKQVEAGQVARRAAEEGTLYASFPGGKAGAETAVAWAVENYTPAQKEAYEAARAKGGSAYQDQLELLQARASKAGALKAPDAAPEAGRRGPPPRRSSTPARSATQGTQPGGAQSSSDGYATKEQYDEAWAGALRDVDDARRSGNRDDLRKAERAREDVRTKLRRSRF